MQGELVSLTGLMANEDKITKRKLLYLNGLGLCLAVAHLASLLRTCCGNFLVQLFHRFVEHSLVLFSCEVEPIYVANFLQVGQ